MKWLGFSLLFLGFLILGVFFMLFFAPRSVSYSNEFHVQADPKRVWFSLTEPSQVILWIDNLDSVGSFEPIPLKSGSQRKMKYNGSVDLLIYEVVEALSPYEWIVLRSDLRDLMQLRREIRIRKTEQGCEILFTTKVTALKRAMRFSLLGARQSMKEQTRKDCEKLKKLLHS